MTTGDEPMLQQPQPFQPSGNEPRLGGDRREVLPAEPSGRVWRVVFTSIFRSVEHVHIFIQWLFRRDPLIVRIRHTYVIVPADPANIDWQTFSPLYTGGGEVIKEYRFDAYIIRIDGPRLPLENEHELFEVAARYRITLEEVGPYPFDSEPIELGYGMRDQHE